jgi:signal peptidase I
MRRPRLRDVPFVLVAATFVAWFGLLRPTGLGGPAGYVLISGTSMEPTLQDGDLVIVRARDTYAQGDIAAFRVPQGEPGAGRLVIHRIVGGSTVDGFVMKGDNKQLPDDWRPTPTDVVGTLWLVLPGAGPYLAWLREPAVFGALAAGLAVFMIMIGGGGSTKQPSRQEANQPGTTSSPDPYAWTVARGLAVGGRRVAPASGAALVEIQRNSADSSRQHAVRSSSAPLSSGE